MYTSFMSKEVSVSRKNIRKISLTLLGLVIAIFTANFLYQGVYCSALIGTSNSPLPGYEKPPSLKDFRFFKCSYYPKSAGSNVTKESGNPLGSPTHVPTPIDRSKLLSGKFTENRSPDGKFIAHTFDNEQGDSGVYLTSSSGVEVTATYCGYFREWSPDSEKIKVFVPYTCGKNVSENELFELHTNGTVSK
jgi:hypothetical protein